MYSSTALIYAHPAVSKNDFGHHQLKTKRLTLSRKTPRQYQVSTVGTDEKHARTVDREMDRTLLIDRDSPIDRLVELDGSFENTSRRA
jgi:hypothetical protein